MIGLMFLVGIVFWITVAVMLSKRIPRWVGMTRYTAAASVLVFPVVLVAPIADDLIGRWQFYRLCDREAVVTLSPDWEKVRRAKRVDIQSKYFTTYLIPISSAGGEYVDLDSGKVFMTHRALFTKGGFLRRNMYGLDGITSCLPKDAQAIEKKINFYDLLKQGESN